MGDGIVADFHEDLDAEATQGIADRIDVFLSPDEPIHATILVDAQGSSILGKSADGQSGKYDEQQIFSHFLQVCFDAAKLQLFFINFVALSEIR